MGNYWLVNSADTSEIVGHPSGRAWTDGDDITTPPEGAANPADWIDASWRIWQSNPPQDLYDEVRLAPTRPDQPYDKQAGDTRVFVPDPAVRVGGHVDVQQQYQQITLDELLARKLGELESYALFVTYQSVLSTTSSNFWIVVDERQRQRLQSKDLVLTDRIKDRTLANDSGAVPITTKTVESYWARDPYIRLLRNSNGQQLNASVDEVSWGQAMKDIGLYDDAVENAFIACNGDIDAAYQAADWAALAAIDAQAAAYGWPAYYTGPVSVGIRTV